MNIVDTASELIRTDPALAHEIARQLASSTGGLTKRQADALAIIRDFHRKHGFTPSFDEIRKELGLASKSRVFDIVNGLEKRGYITRLHGHARSIALVGVAV
jgi:SOS-response transcriptional repressor LexA